MQAIGRDESRVNKKLAVIFRAAGADNNAFNGFLKELSYVER
jgi:hypothetical protein